MKIDVLNLKVVKEKEVQIQIERIKGPEDIHLIFKDYLEGLDKEHFCIALLGTKLEINGLHTVSIGSLNSSIVHPREVFKIAILKNSASIILAHNHPSGDTSPSKEDILITKRIVEGGKILGIEVLDHIIIGDGGRYKSLQEDGLM